MIGRPSKVTTVDKYQGQQNDYILLSLVKTRAVGHLRDVRRLVVAMSRARLGFYVFARVSLFKNCFELTPAFHQLMQRPLKLKLLPNESYPAQRLNDEKPTTQPMEIEDMPHVAKFVYDFYMSKVSGLKEENKDWAKPGTTHQTGSHPEHHVPLHPGADDGKSDDEEDDNEKQNDNDNITVNEKKKNEDIIVPIQDLIEEPMEEG